MRNRFDAQLAELNNELIAMGSLIEEAIAKASEAFCLRDCQKAQEVIEFDVEVNQKEKEIESLCLKLLLHQQPVARDLRFISAALKMITDMERIGDQATDICEIILWQQDKPYLKGPKYIPQMAQATIKMVNESIDAFVDRDLELARAVIDYDDVVDDFFSKIKADLIELIRENAENGEQALDLLMIAKYFERIGDHAVNIAEWVVFAISGEHKNERII
ncbi:MAG: phosphate signaling complex protein PhoU [Clostridiales bacterium]